MKWSKAKKYSPFDEGWYKTSKKDKYNCKVEWDAWGNRFYFYCEHTKDTAKVYNSLWKNQEYETEEECMRACERWINERTSDSSGEC